MKLVGKVPVEPLAEERLTNIERNLVVRVSELREQRTVRAPRRLLAFAGVAMAVAVAALVGWKLHRDPVLPAPAAEQLAMKNGALVVDGAEIAGTDFVVTHQRGRVDVVMEHAGRLDLHVVHDPSRLLVVKVGDVVIEDVGTRFSIDYDGHDVEVRVTEGAVKVTRGGREQTVAAGNAWTLELGPITIAELDKHTPRVAAAQPAAPDAAPEIPKVDNPTEVAGPIARSGSGSGSNAAGGSGSGSGGGSRHKAGVTNAHKALANAPLVDEPLDIGIADPKQALLEYSQRASGVGSAQDTGVMLYSMAVVQHRAANDAGALHTLQAVTRREGGSRYQAGMWLEVVIRCGHAFDESCRRAAERYRTKFPAGHQTGVADVIVSEIAAQ
jgi:hypothetical protein